MKYCILLLFGAFFVLITLQGQDSVTVKRERVFTGKGLYGYMNGGADGIYSTHVFKCQRADTLGCFDCLAPYVLQAAAGNLYISIVFQSGSDAAQKAADELLLSLIPVDCPESVVIPELLAEYKPYSGVLKFLRGPISVSSVEFQLSKILAGIFYSGVWFVSDKEKKENKALIYLCNNEDVAIVRERIPKVDVIQKGEGFIFFRCENPKESVIDDGSFGF